MSQAPETNSLQANTTPIRESAFYTQIKSSTDSGDSASFALLMSMLTTDAQELDEFHLPHTNPAKVKDDLYQQFDLQQRELQGEFDQARSLSMNDLVHQGHRDSVALQLQLQPEPLLPTSQTLPDEVLSNLEPNALARVSKSHQLSAARNEPKETVEQVKPTLNKAEKEIDVEAWFKVLHQSRTFETAA